MFEESLIESLRRRKSLRGGIPLLVALAIHAAVAVLLLVSRVWAIEDIPAPPVKITYWLEVPVVPPPPPPPPPAPKAAPKPEVPKPELVPEPQVLTQPEVLPQEVPQDPGVVGVEGGVENGVEGGVVGGVEGGVVGGELGGVPGGVVGGVPGGMVGGPLRAGLGGVKEPKLLYSVRPIYPETARSARVQGAVLLELTIDRQGGVREVKVLRGLPQGLTEAAIDAVKQWRYESSTLQGEPIEVIFIVTVRFNLI